MQFMATWTIAPGEHKAAAEAFLQGGAPAADGMTILGRWHAPGSQRGWALIETDDPAALAAHAMQWSSQLVIEHTPVVSDEITGAAMAKVYG